MTPPICVRRELVECGNGRFWPNRLPWVIRYNGRLVSRFATGALALAAVNADLKEHQDA